jgi:hypothetical protein
MCGVAPRIFNQQGISLAEVTSPGSPAAIADALNFGLTMSEFFQALGSGDK